jgi:nicotinate-nucleotide pyrophosphorylase (carboxylating)
MKNFDEQLRKLVDSALIEDVGDGDHSTLCCIPADAKGKAVLKIKQDGILAGLDVAEKIFKYKKPSANFIKHKADGDEMKFGEVAFEVETSIHTILQCERLVLNCMQRMSAIATKTRFLTGLIKGTKARILDTRKTTPNFRLPEKWAVLIGGGQNHRIGLYDMVMLKDNHIDFAGGIEKAIIRTKDYLRARKLNLKIEIEARNLEEVKEIVKTGGADVNMLDNMSVDDMKKAVWITP